MWGKVCVCRNDSFDISVCGSSHSTSVASRTPIIDDGGECESILEGERGRGGRNGTSGKG